MKNIEKFYIYLGKWKTNVRLRSWERVEVQEWEVIASSTPLLWSFKLLEPSLITKIDDEISSHESSIEALKNEFAEKKQALKDKLKEDLSVLESELETTLDYRNEKLEDVKQKKVYVSENIDKALSVIDQQVENLESQKTQIQQIMNGESPTPKASQETKGVANTQSSDDDNKSEKSISQMNLEELKAVANPLGITYEENVTKAILRDLIIAKQEEIETRNGSQNQ